MASLKMDKKMDWVCILLRMVIGIKGSLSMAKLKGWVFNIWFLGKVQQRFIKIIYLMV